MGELMGQRIGIVSYRDAAELQGDFLLTPQLSGLLDANQLDQNMAALGSPNVS
jgi:hypothetical protein